MLWPVYVLDNVRFEHCWLRQAYSSCTPGMHLREDMLVLSWRSMSCSERPSWQQQLLAQGVHKTALKGLLAALTRAKQSCTERRKSLRARLRDNGGSRAEHDGAATPDVGEQWSMHIAVKAAIGLLAHLACKVCCCCSTVLCCPLHAAAPAPVPAP